MRRFHAVLLTTVAGAAIGALGAFLLGPKPTAMAAPGDSYFEIVGTGRQWHFEGPPPHGKRAVSTALKARAIAACIAGTNPLDHCSELIHQDPGGKAYLFPDTINFSGATSSWRITTDIANLADSSTYTTMGGLVDASGAFMFAGTHLQSVTRFVVQGKVKFQRGTKIPVKISGKVMGVSLMSLHYAIGSFHTVGPRKILP